MYICTNDVTSVLKFMSRNILFAFVLLIVFSSCNSLKYVPESKLLLNKVIINTDNSYPSKSEIRRYVRQEPNERFLDIVNLNLFWYNLSGRDSTKWINRTLKNIGDPPVIFDPVMAARSLVAMKSYMISKGFYNSTVDTIIQVKKGKANVIYDIKTNLPYTIRKYFFNADKDSIGKIINTEISNSDIKPGSLLDSDNLNEERTRLVKVLQRNGYYAINNDYFSFSIDSMLGENLADVELILKPFIYRGRSDIDETAVNESFHPVFKINRVYFMLDVPMSSFVRNTSIEPDRIGTGGSFEVSDYDTLNIGQYYFIYRDKPFIDPEALIQNCKILPDQLYDVNAVQRTYTKLNSLEIMKYVNIRFIENAADSTNIRQLDGYVVLTPNLKQSFAFEVEGTNTAGDLGVAGNAGFTHRNFLNGAEVLQVKLHGAYEALSTSFRSDYIEYGGEMGLTFPDFKMPFFTSAVKSKIDAKTELNISYQNMSRPEFIRKVASGAMRYNWTKNTYRHTLDLLDLSYIYMPWVDSTFQANYLTSNSYLRYSYENHFILRSAYSFSYSSVPPGTTNRTYFTWRGSFESAGNSLYGLYSLLGASKDEGSYKIGNISFAQYLKGEAEYSRSIVLNSRNRFAFRTGVGIAYPYGNSKILPFEKRFFSGGANSVRGWSVRTLGPGSYKSVTNGIDFMNQSGDIKLDLGFEYRSILFWKLESALFADMGNIWTIREYSGQPGGLFNPLTFYKEMAGSLGLGIRIDFGFFLARFDVGMKVYDPAMTGNDKWRIKSIDNTDDFAFHLAFGYPF